MNLRLKRFSNPCAISLSDPREISFASEIPSPGIFSIKNDFKTVRLRAVVDAYTASFVFAFGAFRQGHFWVIKRSDPFPFDLDQHLPRMAHRFVTPEIVETHRPSSIFSSLENMICRQSWFRLTADIWRSERVCFECGSVPLKPERLEGYENWINRIDDRKGLVRELIAIRILCPPCLAMKFPGQALNHGRFDMLFDRLCLINRVRPEEKREYLNAIKLNSNFLTGHSSFFIDVGILGERKLKLKPGFRILDDNAISHESENKVIKLENGIVSKKGNDIFISGLGGEGFFS